MFDFGRWFSIGLGRCSLFQNITKLLCLHLAMLEILIGGSLICGRSCLSISSCHIFHNCALEVAAFLAEATNFLAANPSANLASTMTHFYNSFLPAQSAYWAITGPEAISPAMIDTTDLGSNTQRDLKQNKKCLPGILSLPGISRLRKNN